MKTTIYLLFTSIIVFSCTKVDKEPLVTIQPDPDNAGLTLPEGFGATVVADTLGRARHIVARDNGDLYINLRSLKNEKGLVALRDNNDDGHADEIEYFTDQAGTGIDIYNNYLYYSNDSTIFRVPLEENTLVPTGTPEEMISGLLEKRQHAVKTFTFDEQGYIYVNVGAPANACQEQMRTPGSPGYGSMPDP